MCLHWFHALHAFQQTRPSQSGPELCASVGHLSLTPPAAETSKIILMHCTPAPFYFFFPVNVLLHLNETSELENNQELETGELLNTERTYFDAPYINGSFNNSHFLRFCFFIGDSDTLNPQYSLPACLDAPEVK